jgi:hypothetical protein
MDCRGLFDRIKNIVEKVHMGIFDFIPFGINAAAVSSIVAAASTANRESQSENDNPETENIHTPTNRSDIEQMSMAEYREWRESGGGNTPFNSSTQHPDSKYSHDSALSADHAQRLDVSQYRQWAARNREDHERAAARMDEDREAHEWRDMLSQAQPFSQDSSIHAIPDGTIITIRRPHKFEPSKQHSNNTEDTPVVILGKRKLNLDGV